MDTFIIALVSILLIDLIVLVKIINISNSKEYKPSQVIKFTRILAAKIRMFITNIIFS